ncbi:MAG: ubiquinol oxidase subunit II [Buchnera aphidicola (Nurudea yanoniella)]
MFFLKCRKFILSFFLINFILFLTGCNCGFLHPKGFIAEEQKFLIIIAFITMLFIIVPVFFMTFLFFIKYRESNLNVHYRPNWSHSSVIELLIWGFPVIIIVFLSILSWKSTHDLDPRKHIVSDFSPIKINVISLDWKWLFIYPNEKIATINELVFPMNTPIIFELTSNSVMNSFFIPALGSQIYTMAGMHTTLNLIANKFGIYKGISANYSGKGFSNMKFKTVVTPDISSFKRWINKVQCSKNYLNSMLRFKEIAIPNENSIIQYYSNVKKDLFNIVIRNNKNIHK